MLGFSLYFDRDFDLENEVSKYEGFDILFTSIHYPEGSETFEKFLDLCEKSLDKNFNICVDLNKDVLSKNPKLLDMDLILRLDYGFNPKEIAELSKNNRISINASTIDRKILEKILAFGANKDNILAIHNYYPLEFSGMGEDYLKRRNDLFKSLGIETIAFVAGNENLRGPMHKGLPTLESHRLKDPYLSFVELKRKYGMDSIIIAEGVDDRNISNIRDFHKDNRLSLKVRMNDGFNHIKGFRQRMDLSEFILRNEREYRKVEASISFYAKRGDILILNEKAGRYSGEIEICKRDLGLVADRNLIGKVDKEHIELIDYIKGGDDLVFDRR
ncbi:MupG family TIM beta-alpha barrel fold protein [uncultured Anaerococcus sp.]|uniref:MupG family TIM beta-alpha barrel fold protein n=1 Tax=uncultured Anaerococcus sp. TaxID=293428 RepID=UPI002804EE84|nr:MupG family TIM beta-alpha barrel fold protein [uncultured Anaerococcus sp.]